MAHKAIGTLINIEAPSALDLIHIRRKDHATSLMIAELLMVRNAAVQRILDAYSVIGLSGQRYGITYADGCPQILEKELAEVKAQLKKAAKAKKK